MVVTARGHQPPAPATSSQPGPDRGGEGDACHKNRCLDRLVRFVFSNLCVFQFSSNFRLVQTPPGLIGAKLVGCLGGMLCFIVCFVSLPRPDKIFEWIYAWQPEPLSEIHYAIFLGMPLRMRKAWLGWCWGSYLAHNRCALLVLGTLQMVPVIPKSGQTNTTELHISCGW